MTARIWWGLGAVTLVVVGCQVKERESTPVPESTARSAASAAPATAAALAAPKRAATPQLGSYPNGGALLVDPSTCTAARVHDTVRWTHSFAPCAETLDGVVALDSTAIVRTPSALVGLDPEGNESWKVPLTQPPPPSPIATPTVTRDSLAVVALSPQLVVAYRKGQEAWRAVLPASEALVAAPMGSLTEGVLLASARGVRALGADGSLRWTSAPGGAQSAK